MKKIDGKVLFNKFISGTFIFLLATAFAVIFKVLFGENNTYVGVTSYIAMLMYLERDLTTNFFTNLFKFILINLAMGLVVFIGGYNLWLAIPLNFALMIIVGYITCNELRTPTYVPFMLQFVLLIAFPVPHSQEGMRLLALFVGAITIMIPQLLLNRNRVKKNSVKIFLNLNNLIKQKVILLDEEKDISIVQEQINGVLRSFKYLIFDSREKNFYISKEGEASLSLVTALEKLNIALSNLEVIDRNITTFIIKYFDKLNELLEGKISMDEFIAKTEKFIEENEEYLSESKRLQIVNSLILINAALLETRKEKVDLKKNFKETKERFKVSRKLSRETKNSLGFSYAVRVAIGMTITCFLTQYFHLEEGTWMMFTIFSLVNPIYETTKFKTKDRIISTLLGAVAVIILLSIFKSGVERTAVLMVVGYIMCYTKQYKYNIFLATICIITLATGTGNVYDFAFQRIAFVIIGMIVAIILNTFVLRCDLHTLNNRFKKKYENTIYSMIEYIYFMAQNGKVDSLGMQNLFLVCAAIDKVMRDNSSVAGVPFKEQIKLNNYILVSDIYILYTELEKYIDDEKYRKFVMKSIERMKSLEKNSDVIEEFRQNIESSEGLEIKLAYANILEIFEKFKPLIDNIKEENAENVVCS
ncbi:FUSC family protein [uncultured Clostridium sp.]|uniref:FUSC family protein n=1 Tax=uncultured Clostridium sp. TaxID=59620 RepID=UPI0026373B20|nr:FUSC family protein [uncultured Clostridium sp.]